MSSTPPASRETAGPDPAPRVRPRSQHPISRKQIDPDALKVLYRLSSAGHKAYLVGGSVRDLLLSRTPKDFDIGTDATPQAVRRMFRNCRLIGRRFRLAHILFPGGKVVEVATFRKRPEPLDPERARAPDDGGQHLRHGARGRVAARFHDQRPLLRHLGFRDPGLRRRPRRPRGGPDPNDRRRRRAVPRGPRADAARRRVREPAGVRDHARRLRGDPRAPKGDRASPRRRA